MATSLKLRIVDNEDLRKKIDKFYESMDHVSLAKWSLVLAKHILGMVDINHLLIGKIANAFKVNEEWQIGNVRVSDLRQAGFLIHDLARKNNSPIEKTALRVVGHAIASGHMKEHAMVASDYAIKLIGLIHNNDIKRIYDERNWQLGEMKKIKSKII